MVSIFLIARNQDQLFIFCNKISEKGILVVDQISVILVLHAFFGQTFIWIEDQSTRDCLKYKNGYCLFSLVREGGEGGPGRDLG